MRTEVRHNPDFAAVLIIFDAMGERVVAEAGAMIARDSGIEMITELRGGMGSALKRRLMGGESLFQNTFVASQSGQQLWIAPAPEGSIQQLELRPGQSLFLQSGAYLASTQGVQLDTKWQGAKGFFAGEGLFLLRAYGEGTLWFSSYGGIHTVDVGDAYHGYVCDTSHIVAFSDGLQYQVERVGGLKGLLASGEGLVCRFGGVGRLWMQTRNPVALGGFLGAFASGGHG